ncbi:hypothetical protein [Mucilaginibacter sp. SP1R1]|uniref:hypothetical protein n=1 Tax=Mucilaginibacter sp. SP1R1 TaxID=2723091 RepID=UPI0017F4C96B|nr:hypothetical protein [Mucilaginibacter sp. SP1R1]
MLVLLGIAFVCVILFFIFFQKNNDGVTIIGIMTTGAIFLLVAWLSTKSYIENREIYNSKDLLFVEGRVMKYCSMPYEGHADETFEVNGVGFVFSDYQQIGIGGYNNAASHGGVIKSNLYVRIGYYNNGERKVILQLETE